MRASLSQELALRLGDLVARVIQRLEAWGYVASEFGGDALA